MTETLNSQALNATEGVNPDAVPQRTLRTGARMPAIGLGTFGSDTYTAAQVADAVRGAAQVGYRHFDCASVYGNEPEIGAALADILSGESVGGVLREELWVTSKLWNDRHAEDDVLPACRQSLSALGLEFLDLYLVHWPFPNTHARGVDGSSRDSQAQGYRHESFLKTWRQMERLVDEGLVRQIGTSNMTIPKLTRLLDDARIPPAVNEMELHPHFQQPDLFEFVVENGMVPVGYSPLGSPSRPARDTASADTVDLDDPVIVQMAARLEVSPAALCIQWAIQRGQVPIPFSVKRPQYLSSLQAAVRAPLTESDMAQIAALDKNCRLIKGQVFLWKDGQSWEDLWDPHGEITPA